MARHALAKDTFMHNDPHSPFSPCGLPPNALEDAFQRAHTHARTTAPLGGAAAPTVDPSSRVAPCNHACADDEPLLDDDELLRVLSEPIEWLLTLAHRLASGESDDVAAVDRLRAAFHARLAGRPIGVRMSDVLTTFALLLGAFDPGVVLQAVTRTIADGMATILTCDGAVVAAQLASVADALPAMARLVSIADALPARFIDRACVPRRRRSRTARTTTTP
jgi:hypothetical protein